MGHSWPSASAAGAAPPAPQALSIGPCLLGPTWATRLLWVLTDHGEPFGDGRVPALDACLPALCGGGLLQVTTGLRGVSHVT